MRILVPIAAVLLAGCGGSAVVDRGGSATPPYEGPLDAGAAVAALECDGKTAYRRGEGVYDDGLATVQASPEAALEDYMSESGLSFFTPSAGYAVEREQGGRSESGWLCAQARFGLAARATCRPLHERGGDCGQVGAYLTRLDQQPN